MSTIFSKAVLELCNLAVIEAVKVQESKSSSGMFLGFFYDKDLSRQQSLLLQRLQRKLLKLSSFENDETCYQTIRLLLEETERAIVAARVAKKKTDNESEALDALRHLKLNVEFFYLDVEKNPRYVNQPFDKAQEVMLRYDEIYRHGKERILPKYPSPESRFNHPVFRNDSVSPIHKKAKSTLFLKVAKNLINRLLIRELASIDSNLAPQDASLQQSLLLNLQKEILRFSSNSTDLESKKAIREILRITRDSIFSIWKRYPDFSIDSIPVISNLDKLSISIENFFNKLTELNTCVKLLDQAYEKRPISILLLYAVLYLGENVFEPQWVNQELKLDKERLLIHELEVAIINDKPASPLVDQQRTVISTIEKIAGDNKTAVSDSAIIDSKIMVFSFVFFSGYVPLGYKPGLGRLDKCLALAMAAVKGLKEGENMHADSYHPKSE